MFGPNAVPNTKILRYFTRLVKTKAPWWQKVLPEDQIEDIMTLPSTESWDNQAKISSNNLQTR